MSIATAPESPGDRLVSGEAVVLDVRIARLGSRAIALMIDVIGQVLLFAVLLMLSSLFSLAAIFAGLFDEGLGQAIFTIILVITAFGYPVIFETLLRDLGASDEGAQEGEVENLDALAGRQWHPL